MNEKNGFLSAKLRAAFFSRIFFFSKVRHTVISKVEMWIMNPKVSRVAQELLMTVAMNCNSHSQNDMEILVSFSKLR